MPNIIDRDSLSSSDGNTPHTRTINIGGKATVLMGKGDKLVIETPGGGAWGVSDGTPENAGDGWKPEWSARGSVRDREAVQAEF